MGRPRPRVRRQTVNLSQYPDLVVIYLGMRLSSPRGIGKLVRTGRQIAAAVDAQPDGLLLHENLFFSLIPPRRWCPRRVSPTTRQPAD